MALARNAAQIAPKFATLATWCKAQHYIRDSPGKSMAERIEPDFLRQL